MESYTSYREPSGRSPAERSRGKDESRGKQCPGGGVPREGALLSAQVADQLTFLKDLTVAIDVAPDLQPTSTDMSLAHDEMIGTGIADAAQARRPLASTDMSQGKTAVLRPASR